MTEQPQSRHASRVERDAYNRMQVQYLQSIETVSSKHLDEISRRSGDSDAETVSRWMRDGLIFCIVVDGEQRVPSFQLIDGAPRPEIACILRALPPYLRSGWTAAFWFASGHGYLGCAPQAALAGSERVQAVIEAAERTGRVIG